MNYKCPRCQMELRVVDGKKDRMVICPRCKIQMTLISYIYFHKLKGSQCHICSTSKPLGLRYDKDGCLEVFCKCGFKDSLFAYFAKIYEITKIINNRPYNIKPKSDIAWNHRHH